MRFGRLPLLPVVAVLALTPGLAACGDDEPDIPGDAEPAAAAVIDDWSTKLREGDVDAAAAMFAIPSVAQNGLTIEKIENLADARQFNASLPCGAELIRAEPDGDLVLATFRLTERPGPGSCGSGTGETAQTTFLIEDGQIVEWRRVFTDEDLAPEAPSSST